MCQLQIKGEVQLFPMNTVEAASTRIEKTVRRHELKELAKKHRRTGLSISLIADKMELTRGHVWSLLSQRVKAYPSPKPSESTTVKRITYNGGTSWRCEDAFISLKRIPLIDGLFKEPAVGSLKNDAGITLH